MKLQAIFSSSKGDFALFAFLILVSLFYILYIFTIHNSSIRERFFRRFGNENGSFWLFISSKTYGFLLLGVLPALTAVLLFPYRLRDMGFAFPGIGQPLNTALLWALILGLLAVAVVWFKNWRIARSHGDFGKYPEITYTRWSWEIITVHIVFWLLYLVGYELLMRGVLLYVLAYNFGLLPAIGAATAVYVLAHIHKGLQETLGAFILGPIFCLITLVTGSIMTAVIVHTILAAANALFILHYKPDLDFDLEFLWALRERKKQKMWE
ncbi:MAG: CPBP family intramembrane glutamic endopeptidase [Spirochaetota bacterium]